MTPNCTNSDGGNNGVELRDINNPAVSTQHTPDELTGLTEHLRRQTGTGTKSPCCQSRGAPPHQADIHHQISGKITHNRLQSPRSPRSPRQLLHLARQRQNQRFAKIDRVFLVLFPLMFAIFNCIYWLAYYTAEVERVEAEASG